MIPLILFCAGSLGIIGLTGLTVYYTMPRGLLDIIQHRNDVLFHFPETGDRKIYLTIDDTPTANTTLILDILDKYNVKASFFVINNDYEDFDSVIADIHNRGHEICNHTSHRNASVRLPVDTFEVSVSDCSKRIEEITGVSPKWFRPGSGFWNNRITQYVQNMGMQTVLGDVYPHDAHIPIPAINAWYIRKFIRDGSIIILHDRQWTLSLLETIIPELLDRGFVFTRLSDGLKQ